ncbi:uncharacterized protein LOC114319708 [Camellia sinensis]|uniref:uncharacterized protein LOC114319708 n=1 Tax=Camellia sinensis TaxID=4442 RepID=UPI001035A1ED|nr:uncharacterized protein LOC114319708 [Camellia sinensis]
MTGFHENGKLVSAKVWSRRLKKVMSSIISEVQTVFSRGRFIVDGVLIANEVVDWWKPAKMSGIILKLDFEKAYDSVNWEFLLSILMNFGLNLLIERAKELGYLKGASVGPNGLKFSYLQFADDTVVFCEADRVELVTIKRILWCFELMSSLKINSHKSVVCRVGADKEDIKDFVSVLHCHNQKLLITYLGIPLGANPRRKSTWKPMIKKVKKKLASWKGKMLSFASRITLIKAVLSSLPFYFFSIFKLSMDMAKQLDKIQVWSDILKLVDRRPALAEFYLSNFKLSIGNRGRIQFWDDKWLNNLCLKKEFPRLYRLSVEKGSTVQQIYLRMSHSNEWNLIFRRSLLKWEKEEVLRLYELLRDALTLSLESDDSSQWMAKPEGSFTIVAA